MKKLTKQFRYGEKGFTLIELLVVIAILGVLAAVAVPNVGRFIGQGKTEAFATELHNVQTALMAILVESASGELDADYTTATDDMSTIKATDATTGDLALSDYLTGLDADNKIKSGCKYAFTKEGEVTQTAPQ